MLKEIPGKCFVCGSETEATKISCNVCDTSIEGHFKPCKFCRLNPDQKHFLDIFVKCRGNIKEIEKELGVSYPTVKNKLEDVASALGHKAASPENENAKNRKEVLDKLNNGEISVEEALSMLKSNP